MKKIWINFWVDCVMFLSMSSMAVTGVIQRWVLPPSHGGRRGLGAETLLGYTRHQWGDLHFWLAVLLVAMLTIHIILHWNWIVCRLRALFGKSRAETCEKDG